MATNNFDYNTIFKNLGIAGGIGSGLSGIAGLFGLGKGKNPATEANNYLDQIPGQTNPYYQDAINRGQYTAPNQQALYQQLANNPGETFNKLGEGYKESPGYQFKLKQGLGAASNASAQGGTLGTPFHQENATKVAEGYADQDFMNHILGIMNTGLTGQEGIVNRGNEAGQKYADILGNVTGQKAQYGYAGEEGENKGKANNWSDLFSGLSSAAPWLFM